MKHPLRGKLVHLHPVHPEDYHLLADWASDPAHLGLWTADRRILSHEEAVERAVYRLQNVELTRFMVIDNVTEESVGTVFAYDAHLDDGYCFFTVYTVPDFVGKGHGAEAAILMADYLFSNFSWLHKLYSDVYEYNTRSLRLNRKAGLQEEGCFREHRFYAGRRWDMYRFALYRHQWEERRSSYLSIQNDEMIEPDGRKDLPHLRSLR